MLLKFDRNQTPLRLAALVLAFLLAGALAGCQKTALQYRQAGWQAKNNGNWQKAETLYAKSVERNPSNVEGYYWLGVSQLELDRPLDAKLSLERAWTLEPDNPAWTPRILNVLAQANYEADNQQALFDFLSTQAERYKTSDAFLRQGKYLALAGDVDNAELAYAKAIRFADPQDAEPYVEAGAFYARHNDRAKAIEMLRYANYLDPGNEQVAASFRQIGVVPGPAQSAPPPARD